ncbi:MAG: hypothetical protein M3132_09410, partial [Actinomycetia bacterium]|nr:hypothetical protein [Actinomycetes bacterium]
SANSPKQPSSSPGRTDPRHLTDVRERVVVCGHSHIARVVTLKGGTIVVNPRLGARHRKSEHRLTIDTAPTRDLGVLTWVRFLPTEL